MKRRPNANGSGDRENVSPAERKSWIEQAHGKARGSGEPARRGPGYSVDPHANGNERADDRIVVTGPRGGIVHARRY